jgi:lipid-A-disaccharide synthase-like uncharacterized protein
MQWIGYVGIVALAICWFPQSWETAKKGGCEMNLYFLILGSIGNISLVIYAISIGDTVFSVLNVITTFGSLFNLFYKLFPRTRARASLNPRETPEISPDEFT